MIQAATIQFKPVKGDVSGNRDRIIALLKEAVRNGAELITLPEMCLTGYVWSKREDIFALAEESTGESFQLFSRFCRENSCYLAYGFAEIDLGKLYNAQNLIDPKGELLTTYRKQHLFENDELWAEPGNLGFKIVDTAIGRIGMGICMDLNFNDFILFHYQQRTDYLLLAVNWLDEGVPVHSYWKHRLHPLIGATLIANTFGSEESIDFCGNSCVFHNNRCIQSAPKAGVSILYTKL